MMDPGVYGAHARRGLLQERQELEIASLPSAWLSIRKQSLARWP